jgi:hypothetical protein
MAPERTAKLSGLSALLLVCVMQANPALAATGADTRCDQPVASPQIPVVGDNNLKLQVVDHDTANSSVPGQLSVDGAIADGGSAAPVPDEQPRVETLLRRIFDEPQLRTPDIQVEDDSDALNGPLAVDKSEITEDQTTADPDDATIDMAPGLPGISGDDFVRFKQRMYRTDI